MVANLVLALKGVRTSLKDALLIGEVMFSVFVRRLIKATYAMNVLKDITELRCPIMELASLVNATARVYSMQDAIRKRVNAFANQASKDYVAMFVKLEDTF